MATNPIQTANPDRTVLLIADTGKIYKLTSEVWERDDLEMKEPGSLGIVKQLEAFGAYLAFVPQDIAIGLGTCCIVVNQREVLKGRALTSTTAASTAEDGTSEYAIKRPQ